MLHDKNKKQGASNNYNDTYEKGIFYHTRIATIVSAKSWETVASSDDDDVLLPSLQSTPLAKREC